MYSEITSQILIIKDIFKQSERLKKKYPQFFFCAFSFLFHLHFHLIYAFRLLKAYETIAITATISIQMGWLKAEAVVAQEKNLYSILDL